MRSFSKILLVFTNLVYPQKDVPASVRLPASTFVSLLPEVTSLHQGVLEVCKHIALDSVDHDGVRSFQVTSTVGERFVLASNVHKSPVGQKLTFHQAVS